MKFQVTRVSDYGWAVRPDTDERLYQEGEYDYWYIDLHTLEDLMEFINNCGSRVIILDNHITIYDDYIN